MTTPTISFSQRLQASVRALVRLLYFRPAYLLLALGVSVVFYELVYWVLNIGLVQYMLEDPSLIWLDKLEIIVNSYAGVFTYPPSGTAILLLSVSILQGVVMSALVYMVRHNRQSGLRLRDFRVTGVAGVLAVVGLGCAVCGTSLVLPVIAWLFATSSAALADAVGFYSLVLALIMSLVANFVTGDKLADTRAG